MLLVAFALLYPASGAFVSLSQASLMDLEPERREHNMARWTVAGVGRRDRRAAAPGRRPRGPGSAGAGCSPALAVVDARACCSPCGRVPGRGAEAERLRVRDALRAITRREVLRWLLLLELADLLLDVFVGFLALYLVDEAGASHATAGLAVALWAGAGLAGSAAMIPLLRRVDGLRYLRLSAVAAAAALRRVPARAGHGREARRWSRRSRS